MKVSIIVGFNNQPLSGQKIVYVNQDGIVGAGYATINGICSVERPCGADRLLSGTLWADGAEFAKFMREYKNND